MQKLYAEDILGIWIKIAVTRKNEIKNTNFTSKKRKTKNIRLLKSSINITWVCSNVLKCYVNEHSFKYKMKKKSSLALLRNKNVVLQ